VSLLDDKLLELHGKDADVRAKLHDAGAVTENKAKKTKTVDIAKVDRKVIAKAKAHVHAALKVPKPFVHEGISITITALSLEGDVLRVDLEADAPTDGPYFFVNPPLQVVTKEAVMGPLPGLPIVTPRETKDAPDEVLKTIVGQAVHAVALQRGWGDKPPLTGFMKSAAELEL
jgi:hypothetical protein